MPPRTSPDSAMYKLALIAAALALGTLAPAGAQTAAGKPVLDNLCLACLCEASSGCSDVGCRDATYRPDLGPRQLCGPFQIDINLWRKYGHNGTVSFSTNQTEFRACANDFACSEEVVTKYLLEKAELYPAFESLNGETSLNQCWSYYAIHRLGVDFTEYPQGLQQLQADTTFSTCATNLLG